MTTPELEHTAPSANRQADFHALLRDKVCLAVELMLNEIMDWELEAVIGAALYERTTTRRDYRNRHYERGLVTGVGPFTHCSDSGDRTSVWSVLRTQSTTLRFQK